MKSKEEVDTMKKKGEKKKIFCICMELFVLILFFYYMRDDVMAQIYRQKMWGLCGIPAVEGVRDPSEWNFTLELFGSVEVDYKKEYLRDDVSITLRFYHETEKDSVNIYQTIALTDTKDICLNSYYDYSDRILDYGTVYILENGDGDKERKYYTSEEEVDMCLKEYNLTREDVMEYRKYAIYDVIVQTWIEHNGGIYWLEKLKLKNRTTDRTFEFKK